MDLYIAPVDLYIAPVKLYIVREGVWVLPVIEAHAPLNVYAQTIYIFPLRGSTKQATPEKIGSPSQTVPFGSFNGV